MEITTKKYVLKSFIGDNGQDIHINKDTKLLQIGIDENSKYEEKFYKINIYFIEEDKIIDLDLKILIDVPNFIKPIINFKKLKLTTPETINIKDFSIELLQNRHEKVSEVSFDMNISNVSYFFENSDIYINTLKLINPSFKFLDRNIKTIWEISNYQNRTNNKTTFKISRNNDYLVEFQKSSIDHISLRFSKNVNNKRQTFPLIFKNCHIDFNELHLNVIIPQIKFHDCSINFSKTSTDLSFLLLNNCELITSQKIPVFNPVFSDKNSLNKIKNLYLFGNLQTKKKLNLIKYEHSTFIEGSNIFNIILSYILDFKLSIQYSFILLIFFILCGSVIFNQKDMTPADPVTVQTYLNNEMKTKHKDLNVESTQGWSYVDGYQQFNPFLYSVDLSIPFLDLGQTKSWIPIFDDKRIIIDSYFYFLKFISKFLLIFSIIKILDIWKSNEKGENDE